MPDIDPRDNPLDLPDDTYSRDIKRNMVSDLPNDNLMSKVTELSPEAMALRLRPVRSLDQMPTPGVQTRANFRVVNDGLAGTIKRMHEVSAKAAALSTRLTGSSGIAPQPPQAVLSDLVDDNTPIFDMLASQALQLARLVADIEQSLNASSEAVK